MSITNNKKHFISDIIADMIALASVIEAKEIICVLCVWSISQLPGKMPAVVINGHKLGLWSHYNHLDKIFRLAPVPKLWKLNIVI